MITEGIKDILVEALDYAFATDLFIGREPSQPSSCVTLYDTPGGGPDLMLGNEWYSRDAFQVRVRDTQYNRAFQRIEAIINALHGKYNLTYGGYHFRLIQAVTSPHFLEWDENNRPIVVVNFITHSVHSTEP